VNDDDRRLIADCLGGRRDAFGGLVTRYQTRLFNAALRLVQSPEDAADVVQDAFLNAFQSLHTFKGDAEFFTWLYRIAFNIAVSLKRKKRPSISLEMHAGEAGIDPDDPSELVKPGAALERSEDERQLAAALARLSPEHREVLLLKDIEGLKYEDIAVLLAVPIGTIRSRLHRARLELRDLLVPYEGRSEHPIDMPTDMPKDIPIDIQADSQAEQGSETPPPRSSPEPVDRGYGSTEEPDDEQDTRRTHLPRRTRRGE
jgi:RNA polymerase sigma-70 factor, ECF subfamily